MDEASIKRRRRNAESAARLRERRKNQELELTARCAELEDQIKVLTNELIEEKSRAQECLKGGGDGGGSPTAGRANTDSDDNSSDNKSNGRSSIIERMTADMCDVAVTTGEKRRRDSGTSSGAGSTTRDAPSLADGDGDGDGGQHKKIRMLRQLDMDRLSSLRAKIETLGGLNQRVCLSLGVLRQEIQTIASNFPPKKTQECK